MNPHELVAGVLLHHSTHCSCVTLSLTFHFWHASLTSFRFNFQLRQSSQQNLLTREFVVFKLRYESFLCCNRLSTVETSLLTQIVFYLLVMPKLVTNIFISHFQCVVSFSSSLSEIKHISFSNAIPRKPLLQKLTSNLRLCEGSVHKKEISSDDISSLMYSLLSSSKNTNCFQLSQSTVKVELHH